MPAAGSSLMRCVRRLGFSGTTLMWPSRCTSSLWWISSKGLGWITRTHWLLVRARRRPTGEAGRSDEEIALHRQTLAGQRQTLGPARSGYAGHPVQHRPGDSSARGTRRVGGRVPGGARGTAADAGPGSPGHAGGLASLSLRRWRRAGSTPRRRTSSGRCSWHGSGRWAGMTRTRWRPGSLSPVRWRRAGIMPGRTRGSGMCSRHGSGLLGLDHPDTLAAWFAIALEVAARGDHAGAADQEFRDVLAARQRTLGPITRTRWPPGSASPRKWRRAGIMPGRKTSSGTPGQPDADAGLGPPGHADRPVQYRPGDGGARGSCRGGERVAGCAAPSGAEAGAGSPGHAGRPVQHRPGDGGARGSCRFRTGSGTCSRHGSGRWARITRTR